MFYEVMDNFGEHYKLQPKVELYSVRDFMGQEMFGLAIALDEVLEASQETRAFGVLTVSFGEFIGLKNSAYIDTNNCWFAQQLLDKGMATDTGFRKSSGFCEYPLWVFKEEFLKEIESENYAKYSSCYDAYMKAAERMFGGCEEDSEMESDMAAEDNAIALQ